MTLTRLARLVPLLATLWLVGSTVAGNVRTCEYRAHPAGPSTFVNKPAAATCPFTIDG